MNGLRKFDSTCLRLWTLIWLASSFCGISLFGRGEFVETADREFVARYDEIVAVLKSKYSNLILPRIIPKTVDETFEIKLENGKMVAAKALSLKPPIFEVRNFLNEMECDRLIELAQKRGLEESRTLDDFEADDVERLMEINNFTLWDKNNSGFIEVDEVRWVFEQTFDFDYDKENILKMVKELKIDTNEDGLISDIEFKDFNLNKTALNVIKRINKIKSEQPTTKGRYSQHTFIGDDFDPLMLHLRRRLSLLTGLPLDLIEGSEDLQVVKYNPGGHYNCHLDSEEIYRTMDKCCHLPDARTEPRKRCQLCRYMTVLYFLNDVDEGGETAFPLADNETLNEKIWTEDADGLCNLARNCLKSKVVVKPEKGKAILWYNHHRREKSGWLGQIDHHSFHGGCNVHKGVKWIANNWINVSPFRMEDLMSWASLRIENESRTQNEKLSIDEGSHNIRDKIGRDSDAFRNQAYDGKLDSRNSFEKENVETFLEEGPKSGIAMKRNEL